MRPVFGGQSARGDSPVYCLPDWKSVMVITNNVIDQVVVFLEVHEAASGPHDPNRLAAGRHLPFVRRSLVLKSRDAGNPPRYRDKDACGDRRTLAA